MYSAMNLVTIRVRKMLPRNHPDTKYILVYLAMETHYLPKTNLLSLIGFDVVFRIVARNFQEEMSPVPSSINNRD